MSSLADYLAKNYLNPDNDDSKKKKKKKSKKNESTTIVTDKSQLGWNDEDNNLIELQLEDDTPAKVESVRLSKESRGFTRIDGDKIRKGSNLKPILAVEGLKEEEMSSGALPGLQNAEDVDNQIRRKQEAEMQQIMSQDPSISGKEAETVYRDASGRRIDIAMKRAELRAKQLSEAEDQILKQQSVNKGELQKIENLEEAQRLEEAKKLNFSRYSNDETLNSELKRKERYEDPAASFMKTRSPDNTSKTGRKLYTKMYPQNRFNIVPGIKWDGIDRSNGFEELVLKKRGELKSKAQPVEAYTVEIYDDFE